MLKIGFVNIIRWPFLQRTKANKLGERAVHYKIDKQNSMITKYVLIVWKTLSCSVCFELIECRTLLTRNTSRDHHQCEPIFNINLLLIRFSTTSIPFKQRVSVSDSSSVRSKVGNNRRRRTDKNKVEEKYNSAMKSTENCVWFWICCCCCLIDSIRLTYNSSYAKKKSVSHHTIKWCETDSIKVKRLDKCILFCVFHFIFSRSLAIDFKNTDYETYAHNSYSISVLFSLVSPGWLPQNERMNAHIESTSSKITLFLPVCVCKSARNVCARAKTQNRSTEMDI